MDDNSFKLKLRCRRAGTFGVTYFKFGISHLSRKSHEVVIVIRMQNFNLLR